MKFYNDDTPVTFGKHEGSTFGEIAENDAQYLFWLDRQPWCKPEIKIYVKQNRERLIFNTSNNFKIGDDNY